MSRKLSRRQFIGASAGVAAAASLGGASVTLGGGRRAHDPARPARAPAVLACAMRRHGSASRRATGSGCRRPWASSAARTIRPTRPTSARSCRSRAGSPRSSSTSPRSASGASSSSSRRSTSMSWAAQPTAAEIRGYLDDGGLEGGRDAPVRPRQPRSRDRRAHGERRDALRVPRARSGWGTMGFSGNLSQLPNNSPNPANPSVNLPNALGVAGGLRESRDRRPHVRVQEPGGAREPHRRDPGVARGEVLLPPGAGQLPLLQRPGAPGARHGAPDRVGDGQHRPEPLRVADRHPAQLLGPRPLPERDHAPARHQRVGARAGAAAPGAGLAHQGRLPQHRADRDLGGRPARERRGAVLPDVLAHRRRSPTRSCRARATWARGPARTIRTPTRTAPASGSCSRTWAAGSACT